MVRSRTEDQPAQTYGARKPFFRRIAGTMVITVLAVLVWLPSVSSAQAPLKWAEGRILVQPRAGLSEEKLAHILNQSKGRSNTKIRNLNLHIVEVPRQAEQAVVRALSRNPHIKFAEVDALIEPVFIPNDPSYGSQWHLPKVQVPTAWDSTQGEGVTVAVLDTGIDVNHPEFQGQLVEGWNAVSQDSNIADVMGHGTSTAGVIGAATNNANQVAGLAGKSKIMPVRITNQSNGYAYYSDIARGLSWAADHGAKIANISYMVTTASSVTTAANYFRNKGGIVVSSAGNDGTNPGHGENTSMITVSATTSSDTKASWSNYGNFVDVAAPGVSIVTTKNGGGIGAVSGTSFSAPLTAAVVALIMAQNTNLSISEVEAVLENSADDLGSTLYFGAGRVNAAQAVQMAGNTSGGGDTQRPTVSIFNPARDATVDGWVTVDVNSTDNVGVTKVVLYAGSVKVGEDTLAPYQFSWNSANENDGPVTLIAYGYDVANNEGSSGSHPVLVDNVPDAPDNNPPTVSIVNPTNGSTVSRTVQVSVNASDDVSLSSVKLYIDGSLKASSNISPLAYSWNTRKVGSGAHTIKAVAVDGANNSSEIQIQVTRGSSTGGGGSKGGKGRKK